MQNGPHTHREVRAAGKLLDTLRLGKRPDAVFASARTTTHGHCHQCHRRGCEILHGKTIAQARKCTGIFHGAGSGLVFRGSSISPIAVERKLDAEWLFPQEKATLHVSEHCTSIGEMLSRGCGKVQAEGGGDFNPRASHVEAVGTQQVCARARVIAKQPRIFRLTTPKLKNAWGPVRSR